MTAPTAANASIPWHAWPILLFPKRVRDNLERIARSGHYDHLPNLWQLELGVLSMWHRVLFRSDTIGTSSGDPPRRTLRARVLAWRPLRFPFLLAERAVAPWDFTGLVSSEERMIKHLIGAHHDGEQFAYDLSILECYPGGLERALQATQSVTREDTARARWLRDLVVYEGYHERLEAALERALADGVAVSGDGAADPDVAFGAYLRWCASQPPTPSATLAAWREGHFRLARRTGELVSAPV